jgi:branched-chain amino acid transport system substrate-binding protein
VQPFSGLSRPGRARRSIVGAMVVLAALSAALVLSACGSSGGSSSAETTSSEEGAEGSDGAATKGGGEASGAPVKVMGLGTFQATVAYPEAPPAWEAEIKKLNEEGGAGGHEIELIVCNDQGNPQVASQCAREAVEKGVVAVMGSYTVQSAAFLPILEAAKIAYVGADATQEVEATSPVSFPFENQFQTYGAMGYAGGSKGCKKGGLLTENYGAATDEEDEVLEKSFAGAPTGEEVVKRVVVPANTTDYAAAVATMQSAGAECVVAPLPPEEMPKLFAAIGQSSDTEMEVSVAAATVTTELLESLGSKAEGLLVGSTGYLPEAIGNPPEVGEVLKMIEEFEPSAELNIFSISAVATVRILAHVIEEAGSEVSASTVLAGMEELEGFETGISPPFTTTKPGPLSGKPRLFNLQVLIYQVHGGKEKQISEGFVDLGPIIAG